MKDQSRISKRNSAKSRLRSLFLLPGLTWLLVFFVGPVSLVLAYSFFERGVYGGIVYNVTTKNFSQLFDDLYYRTIFETLRIASINSFLCLVVGYPLAYYISTRESNKLKNALIILTLLPFWTNFLVRTFSWMTILGDQGLINSALLNWGIIDKPMELLFTPFAVQIGLLYNYLPFMVLPLYSSVEKIDRNLYQASKDLGASAFQNFRFITLPLSKTGIFTGLFFVFIPSLGEFVIPDLLGGAKTQMLGNTIRDQFLAARNWPLGSAIIFCLMFVLLTAIVIRNKILKGRSI